MTQDRTAKPRSWRVTEGVERAPHRAMFYSMGLTPEDLEKPLIGVASTANEVTPCNMALGRLAQTVKEGIRAGGGTPIEFTAKARIDTTVELEYYRHGGVLNFVLRKFLSES